MSRSSPGLRHAEPTSSIRPPSEDRQSLRGRPHASPASAPVRLNSFLDVDLNAEAGEIPLRTKLNYITVTSHVNGRRCAHQGTPGATKEFSQRHSTLNKLLV